MTPAQSPCTTGSPSSLTRTSKCNQCLGFAGLMCVYVLSCFKAKSREHVSDVLIICIVFATKTSSTRDIYLYRRVCSSSCFSEYRADMEGFPEKSFHDPMMLGKPRSARVYKAGQTTTHFTFNQPSQFGKRRSVVLPIDSVGRRMAGNDSSRR